MMGFQVGVAAGLGLFPGRLHGTVGDTQDALVFDWPKSCGYMQRGWKELREKECNGGRGVCGLFW